MKHFFPARALALALLCCTAFSCAPKSSTDAEGGKADSVPVANAANAIAPSEESSPSGTVDATEYETLGNMEMVAYCLPYPKGEFTEDYDAAEFKGQHVLVSKDKKRKITFAGQMLDLGWDELVAKASSDVKGIQGAQILTDMHTADKLTLSWRVGQQEYHLLKWHRSADQETVSAQLEFPTSDAERVQPWINKIGSSSTLCE